MTLCARPLSSRYRARYKDVNEERTAFYQEQKLDPLPASTGIQVILCRPDLLSKSKRLPCSGRESPRVISKE